MSRKWKPLAMCAAMALAYRQGRKTVTRRLIAMQVQSDGTWFCRGETGHLPANVDPTAFMLAGSPYEPGDGLWLREPIYMLPCGITAYRCDSVNARGAFRGNFRWYWSPASLPGRYMPKVLCRTLAECVAVSVERVQDITCEGILAEGIEPLGADPAGNDPWDDYEVYYVQKFSELWNSLHPKPGERWEDNPWVWHYTTRLLTTDPAGTQRMLTEGDAT